MTTPWNNILQTALLGTDKQPLRSEDLGEDLCPLAEQIDSAASTPDREERFLQLAALAFNYRQAGLMPQRKEGVQVSKPGPEEKPYCSPQAMDVLSDIIAQGQYRLVHLWLTVCREHAQLIRPDLLPALLESAFDKKWLRENILICGGKRAHWLVTLNPDWQEYITPTLSEEEVWQTGKLEERTNLLLALGRTDPDKARALLMNAWPKEDANTRAALLSTYIAGPADLLFIEGLLTDKSKKVREVAFIKLQRIPGSNLLQQYEAALQTRLLLKKEKGLLGLTSKFVLSIQPQAEELSTLVVDSGIEKLSNKKGFSDEENICFQLMPFISPDVYPVLWGKSKKEIVTLFAEDPLGQKLQQGFVGGVINYSDRESARLLAEAGVVTSALLPLLPEQDLDTQAARLFETSPEEAMGYAQTTQKEWGPQLAEAVLRCAAKDNYRYGKSWVSMHIDRMPPKILPILPKIQPHPDLPIASGSWPAISETIQQLLQLKTQIIQAFTK